MRINMPASVIMKRVVLRRSAFRFVKKLVQKGLMFSFGHNSILRAEPGKTGEGWVP
jgi:hypothetical protein